MSDHPRARRPNEDRVLALLTRSGQASRGELARELRLPKATVADLVARLISQGLIASAPVPDSGRQVGSGLIVGDRLHRGARGFAGELAHVQVRENGPVCACGGRGCLIRTISTEMIDLAQPAYEQRLTYPAMIGLAESGDVGMQRLLGDFGRAIGPAAGRSVHAAQPRSFRARRFDRPGRTARHRGDAGGHRPARLPGDVGRGPGGPRFPGKPRRGARRGGPGPARTLTGSYD